MRKKVTFFVLLLSFISMGVPNIPQTPSKSAEDWAKEAKQSADEVKVIEGKVEGISNDFKKSAEQTKNSIAADIESQIKKAKEETLKSIEEETKNQLPEFTNALKQKSDKVVQDFEDDMNKTKEELKNDLNHSVDTAKNKIQTASQQATNAATEAKTSIEKAKQDVQNIAKEVTDAKKEIQTTNENLKKIKDDVENVSDDIDDTVNEIEEIADAVKDDAEKAIQTKNESLSIANNVKDDLAKFKDEYTAKLNALDMKTDLALNGSAAAIAIGNLGSISSNSNRQFQLSAAYGFFGGKHAVALGFSGISNNDRFTYRLSGAVTGNGNLAFGAGAGILFGEKRNTNANYEQLKKEIEELRRMINNR